MATAGVLVLGVLVYYALERWVWKGEGALGSEKGATTRPRGVRGEAGDKMISVGVGASPPPRSGGGGGGGGGGGADVGLPTDEDEKASGDEREGGRTAKGNGTYSVSYLRKNG